jgi:pimeloyl-ACP methyl ester carboxylesterase
VIILLHGLFGSLALWRRVVNAGICAWSSMTVLLLNTVWLF